MDADHGRKVAKERYRRLSGRETRQEIKYGIAETGVPRRVKWQQFVKQSTG
jgi:hypothetical protein